MLKLFTKKQNDILYRQFLTLRKSVFVERMGWALETHGQYEIDEFDDNIAHYSVFVKNGIITAGARGNPMTGDQNRPGSLIEKSVAGRVKNLDFNTDFCPTSDYFEITRFLCETTADQSLSVGKEIVLSLASRARQMGCTHLASISPLIAYAFYKRIGLNPHRISLPIVCSDDNRAYAIFAMPIPKEIDLAWSSPARVFNDEASM